MEVPGPIPAGGPNPITAHNVTQEPQGVDPKTVGVATLLLQQTLIEAVAKAKHTAQRMDSSTATVSSSFVPAENTPDGIPSGMGVTQIFAR